MAKTIKALVNTDLQEINQSYDVIQGAGDKGNPTRIKATKGARYQLEDPAEKNTAPNKIRIKRVGNHLHVLLEGCNEADLIVDGYFEESTKSSAGGLFGRAEDGNLYQYVAEDATTQSALVEGGRPTYQVLGGNAVSEEFALSGLPVATAGFNATTVGAATAGAAAAASGGGGGGGVSATTPNGTDTTEKAKTTAQALKAIKDYANNSSNTGTVPSDADYTAAGVTNVTSSNVSAINSAIKAKAVDSKDKTQTIVTAYNTILAEANGTATDADANVNPVKADYLRIGANLGNGATDAGEDTETFVLFNDIVANRNSTDVNSIDKLNNLARIANAIELIAADGTPTQVLTAQDLADIGVTGAAKFTANQLSNFVRIVASKDNTGGATDSLSELNAIAAGDLTSPEAPILVLDAGVSDGATAAEAEEGAVSVTAALGSSVVVTFKDAAGHSVSKTVTGTGAAQWVGLSAMDLGTGVTQLGDGTITVSALATDAVGNTSVAGISSFTLDTIPPVPVADTNSSDENNVTQKGDVKTNDTALDGTEQFNLVGSNEGTYGKLTLTSSGTYTYTYNNGIIHAITTDVVDTFTYQVTDSAGNSSTSKLAITVMPVNDEPTGSVTISGTAKQGQTLTASNSLADADGLGTISYSWFADGVAIDGAKASTYTLTANEVGKHITAKASYTDGGNNATVVTSTASAAVAVESFISLGASGNLIAPVQVEGKWYYHWDRSGDGTSAGLDDVNHNVLDGIFKYDINGNVNTTVANADGVYGTTDVYRYATINGVPVALPTMNGGMALPQKVGLFGDGNIQNGTTATTGGTSSFDDLMAIWDTSNGTGTGVRLSGIPAGWNSNPWYWSATAASQGHLMAQFATGGVVNTADTNSAYIALQVISTPNTAPVLDATQSPVLATIATTAIAPTNGNTTAGVLVSSLVTGVSDADSGATKGIAITAAASGTVYYSLNGGTKWLSISYTSLTNNNALLLAADADTRVYLQPTTPKEGTTSNALTFRAWDMTQHITEGVLVGTTVNGGKAQFSTTTDTVALTVLTESVTHASAVTVNGATHSAAVVQVLPVVMDLNRDGVLNYGQVTMDVNSDGALDVTKWAGAQDGVLVWDKYMDGLVHDNSQYAFAQYATTYANGLGANGKAATDLSGLAEAFDTNHDGVLSAADAKFAQFKVWQDANQNGVSDAGEVRGLLDWGITSIDLSSDNIVHRPVAGVTEAGRTTATATDGSSMLVSDAAFDYTTLTLKDVLQTEGAPAPVASSSALSSAGATGLVDQLLIDQHMLHQLMST
jgi:VCBS repeat-containing protein